ENFRAKFGAASLKLLHPEAAGGDMRDFRAKFGAASLKPYEAGRTLPPGAKFPRQIRRGLIEAASASDSRLSSGHFRAKFGAASLKLRYLSDDPHGVVEFPLACPRQCTIRPLHTTKPRVCTISESEPLHKAGRDYRELSPDASCPAAEIAIEGYPVIGFGVSSDHCCPN